MIKRAGGGRGGGLLVLVADVAASGSPTERRTEFAVEQQPNKRPSVVPSVLESKPEQNAILFGAAVGLSRGSVSLLPGTGSRNGAS